MQIHSKGVHAQGLLAIDNEINTIIRRKNRAARDQEQFSEEMASPNRVEHPDGVTVDTVRSAGHSGPKNRSPLREVDENEERSLPRERDQQLRPPPNGEKKSVNTGEVKISSSYDLTQIS
nr:hypothetical protein Iba_chr14cCG0940 [Ipomoea batatas]